MFDLICTILQLSTMTTENSTTTSNNTPTAIRCNKCDVMLSTDSTSSAQSDGGGASAAEGVSLVKSCKCKHCKFFFCPVCWTGHMEQLKGQLQGLDAQLNLVGQRLQKKSEQFEVNGWNGRFSHSSTLCRLIDFFLSCLLSASISQLRPYLAVSLSKVQ